MSFDMVTKQALLPSPRYGARMKAAITTALIVSPISFDRFPLSNRKGVKGRS